jgi:hypothetical protein
MSVKRLLITLILVLIVSGIPKTFSIIRSAGDYDIAEDRIENAIENGLTVLDFKDLKYLTKIPDTIRQVKGLWFLNANSAQRLSDISALEGLPDLKHLQLGDTRIKDLVPLSNLQRLEVLDIRDSWVSSLEPLIDLPLLRRLQMNSLGVESLCPLNKIQSLSWVNLYKSYAKDGSQDCFLKLENKISDLTGGSSYKQNYIPGTPYLWKVSFERFLKKLEWS